MSITSNCMVLNVRIGVWQGHRLDKDATRKVTTEAAASDDAARVNKHLIPKDALKPINAAVGVVRTHFYDRTLPWKDNGDRLLPRTIYMEFMAEHSEMVDEFNKTVETFLTHDYLVARDQASFRMGDMFKPEDYPEPRDLRHKFYIALDIDAVTEANDFRVQLDAKSLDAVKSQMEQAMCDRVGRAMGDVWRRLADVTGHFAERMAGDGVFRDTTITNLEEVVELLPALNILEDPQLEAIRQDIKNTLIGYRPADLRKDDIIRSAAASDAARIMEQMRGFMTAMGNA